MICCIRGQKLQMTTAAANRLNELIGNNSNGMVSIPRRRSPRDFTSEVLALRLIVDPSQSGSWYCASTGSARKADLTATYNGISMYYGKYGGNMKDLVFKDSTVSVKRK